MPGASLFGPRERPVTRLESFSDAVFAISATLLVVSLEVPRSFAELEHSLSGFIAFALSFAMLVHIWTVHNGYFRRFGEQDAWTITFNAVLLFVVLFYVYPLKYLALVLVQGFGGFRPGDTRLIESNDQVRELMTLYGLGFAAVFAVVALLYRHTWRRRVALELSADEQAVARFFVGHYLVYVGVAALSVAMSALDVGTKYGAPGWVYGLLGPLCGWHARHRRPAGLRR